MGTSVRGALLGLLLSGAALGSPAARQGLSSSPDSTAPEAEPPEAGVVRRARGAATGVGLGLIALGLGGAGLGVSGLLISSGARSTLDVYTLAHGAPSSGEATVAVELERRMSWGNTLAIAGWISAGVGLAAGIVLLLVDAPSAAPHLALVPLPSGGLISYSLAW